MDLEARQLRRRHDAPGTRSVFCNFNRLLHCRIGDKTQIATIGLAAAYPALVAVIAGTTCGMLLAIVLAVFLGKSFASRLPMRAIHCGAAALFVALGGLFVARALLR
jgi:putative Ca2+/H+ antiporter (TMEM165/GDT1 family)